MSYDIYWTRIPRQEMKTVEYTEEEIEIMRHHSGLCGELNWSDTQEPLVWGDTGLNITSNLYEMFSWAFGVKDWKFIDGKKGSEIFPLLKTAIKKMEFLPNEAKKYDSPNGWGTYPNALTFLKDLLAECVYYKNCYLYISY